MSCLLPWPRLAAQGCFLRRGALRESVSCEDRLYGGFDAKVMFGRDLHKFVRSVRREGVSRGAFEAKAFPEKRLTRESLYKSAIVAEKPSLPRHTVHVSARGRPYCNGNRCRFLRAPSASAPDALRASARRRPARTAATGCVRRSAERRTPRGKDAASRKLMARMNAASRGATGLPPDACGANGPQTRSRVRWPRGWRRPAS